MLEGYARIYSANLEVGILRGVPQVPRGSNSKQSGALLVDWYHWSALWTFELISRLSTMVTSSLNRL